MLPTVPPIGSRRFGPTALSIALLTMLAVACSEDALSPDGQPSITRSVVGDVSSFTKTFTPATIGPGSVSELRFDITSAPGGPVGDLDFTDVLPTNVVISTPANASSTCLDGTLSAPDGGGTIS